MGIDQNMFQYWVREHSRNETNYYKKFYWNQLSYWMTDLILKDPMGMKWSTKIPADPEVHIDVIRTLPDEIKPTDYMVVIHDNETYPVSKRAIGYPDHSDQIGKRIELWLKQKQNELAKETREILSKLLVYGGSETIDMQLVRRKMESIGIEFKPLILAGDYACTTIADAWYQLVRACIKEDLGYSKKYRITSGSFAGSHRMELDFAMVQINSPWTRPFAPEIPSGLCIPQPTDDKYIEEYARKLIDPEAVDPNEHYTYAQDLSWQLEWVINHYNKAGTGNNHCYMTIGRPETLYYYDRTVDYTDVINVTDRKTKKQIWKRKISNSMNGDEPGTSQCLRGIDTAIKDGIMYWHVYFRSWSLWSGFPSNLAALQIAKEYMVLRLKDHGLEIKDGPLLSSCMKLHLYEHEFDLAKMRMYIK